jgi:hypothetical protein
MAMNRQVHLIHFIKYRPERPYRAFQHRSEYNVEFITLGAQALSRCPGFRQAFLTQIDIVPTGKPVFLIPAALAVAN